jgi:hypothetical protein
LVLVQIFSPEARLSVAPAGIVPTCRALPAEVRVTVLPLAVTDVVGLLALVLPELLGRVVVRLVDVEGLEVVVFGVVTAGAGAVELAGTSVSAGCAAVSRFASWMSLLSAESAAAVLLSVFAHAPTKSATDNASVAFNRGIYCTMKSPPFVAWVRPKLMNDCGRQSTCQI